MTDFKLASKLRLFAVISFVIIVLGMALGTVMHFINGGFFNYGGEYSGYKSVTVNYVYTEFGNAEQTEQIEEICESAFEKSGLKSYTKSSANTGVGREIVYKFALSTEENAISTAVTDINAKIAEATKEFNDIPQTRASYFTEETILGGEKALSMAAVSLAVIIAIHVIYTAIRYKLSAMFTAFAVQIHNFGLFAALLALCRVPVTSSVMAFAVLVALITAFCVTFTLEKIKANRKNSDNAKLSIAEIADLSANQTFKTNLLLCALLLISSILVFAFSAISALSLPVILSPALCAFVAFAVCSYGCLFVSPALYPAFFSMCGKFTAKPSQNKGK